VTLLDVISSARDPKVEDKVTSALQVQEGLEKKGKGDELSARRFSGADEVGVYTASRQES